MGERTDVFITHDWGIDAAGRNNHDRVGQINAGLKSVGLTTWFDSEKMTGNVKDKMTEGIDNATVIVVCITKRYVEKVAQKQNAEDNCKLEFNYAANRKTATMMVPVVMEQRMAKTAGWEGSVGLVLGTELYVDLWGDLDDPQYFKTAISNLHREVLQRVRSQQCPVALKPSATPGHLPSAAISTGTASSAITPTTTPYVTQQVTGMRSLMSLTVAEVSILMTHLKMSKYAPGFTDHEVDGETLCTVESIGEIVQMGVDLKPKATILLRRLQDFKVGGVPSGLLAGNFCAITAGPGGSSGGGGAAVSVGGAAGAPAQAGDLTVQPLQHKLGSGPGANLYYCGRRLGVAAIPGSDGMCGPSNGPQCEACKAHQTAHPPPYYAGCVMRIKSTPVEEAKALSAAYGGWAARMLPMLCREGTLVAIDATGGLRIAVDGVNCSWNPALVEFVSAPPFMVGEVVLVRRIPVDEAQRLFAQQRGVWTEEVADMLGKVGKVSAFGGSGFVQVKINSLTALVATDLLESASTAFAVGTVLRIRNVSLDEGIRYT